MKVSTSIHISDVLNSIEKVAELMNLENEAETYVPCERRELVYWKKNNVLVFRRRQGGSQFESYSSSKFSDVALELKFKSKEGGTDFELKILKKLTEKVFFYFWFSFITLIGMPLSISALFELNGFGDKWIGVLGAPVFLLIGFFAYLFLKKINKQNTEYMQNSILPCIGAAYAA